MACFDNIGPVPVDPTYGNAFPRAVTPGRDEVYTANPNAIQVYTWPGLVFVSTYATTSGTGADVAIDPAGVVFHSDVISSTAVRIYRDNVFLTDITVASTISGGGLAYADGWLWATVSTNAGGESGALYRIDPDTGSSTTPHTVTGFQLGPRPHAAVDGAVWYNDSLATIVYRHDSGSTTSATVNVAASFMPRPGGTMLVFRSSPAGFVDISPALSIGAPSCDPAGADVPILAFTSADHRDVGFTDFSGNVWRSLVGGRWWLGVAGWS